MAEGYQVIARRWRPKQFNELVGQEHIVRTLSNAIEQNRIAHAYLFVGPRGTGKTTTARIFAKALNAEGGPNANPDDTTSISQSIMNGSCMDVIEIDGASNNGVDDIRSLREECQYAPTEGSFKIYIIDEVHMLSNNAWNALLKTLEEPPSHVKFIFATTEAHKVLPTVVSRCQRFEFRPIPDEQIVAKLGQIAEAESITLEPAALQSIARMADGGMRDAQSILDQLISFCGNSITEANVLDVYGLASEQQIQSMGSAMAQGDYAGLMDLVDQISGEGRDLYRVLMDLQTFARKALLEAIRAKDQVSSLLGVAMTTESLMRMLDALHSGENAIRQGLSQRVNFEVTLLKAIEESRMRAIDSVIKELSQIAAGLPQEAGQKKIETPALVAIATEEKEAHASSEEGASAVTPSPQEIETPVIVLSESKTSEEEWQATESAVDEGNRGSPEQSAPPPEVHSGNESGLAAVHTLHPKGTPQFEAALKKVDPGAAQMLEDLLRAEFKYVRSVSPEELNCN